MAKGLRSFPQTGELDFTRSEKVRFGSAESRRSFLTRAAIGSKRLKQVSRRSSVFTDERKGYAGLAGQQFIHCTVKHLAGYVRGRVHTNSIGNFWSLFKRTLNGTYVGIEPFHLDRCANEQVFRFNKRATRDNKLTDADRFALLMSQVAGKRLTYAQLTGKDADSLCHPEARTGPEGPF